MEEEEEDLALIFLQVAEERIRADEVVGRWDRVGQWGLGDLPVETERKWVVPVEVVHLGGSTEVPDPDRLRAVEHSIMEEAPDHPEEGLQAHIITKVEEWI